MADFFISYNSADRNWAEWIAYLLESNGFTIIIQAWHFRPGSHFILEMQRAAADSTRTLIVLSPDYLKSNYTPSEWAAAFQQDPQGLQRKLIPVMVRPCDPTGILAGIVQIRLLGLDEDQAKEAILDGVAEGPALRRRTPIFPQETVKEFPGPSVGKTPTPMPLADDGKSSPPWRIPRITLYLSISLSFALIVGGPVLWSELQPVDNQRAQVAKPTPTSAAPPAPSPVPVTYTICHGEYKQVCNQNPYEVFEHCGEDNGVGGANPAISAAALCPARPYTTRRTQGGSIGGNHCGYSWFAIDCE